MTKISEEKKADDWAVFSFLKAAQIWSTRPMRYSPIQADQKKPNWAATRPQSANTAHTSEARTHTHIWSAHTHTKSAHTHTHIWSAHTHTKSAHTHTHTSEARTHTSEAHTHTHLKHAHIWSAHTHEERANRQPRQLSSPPIFWAWMNK